MKNPCCRLLCLSLVISGVLLTALGLKAAPLTLYVAPNGNDRWSGRPASPTADGMDGPLATLRAALQAVREVRKDEPGRVAGGVSLLLRGGTYQLAEPVVLGPQDSGVKAEAPLTIGAYPGERPVLSGGRRLTGWKAVSGKPGWWRAEVPEEGDGKWYFRSLFVEGMRKRRARTPNAGFFQIQGESPQDKPAKLHFKAGDIKPEWAQAGDVEVVALLAWADFRMLIRSVDEVNQIATLSTDPRPSNKESNGRYYVENAADGLDAPGEWYLDRKSGQVTYWAESGEVMERAEVVAGCLDELVIFQGDLNGKIPVKHVVLRGLTLSYTDWELPPNGYADTQAAIRVRGEIQAEGAVQCAVEDCTFTHLAGYALELGRGCQGWNVIGNEMSDLGGGGIRLGETVRREDPFELNHSHVLTDNHIHDLGIVYPPAVGVLILLSGRNRVAHNHIHHLFYSSVSVGWNWGYRETPCYGNVIEFNHMHDIGLGILSDMGAVYTLGIQKGTVIRNNLIHDVYSYNYGGWGLYPDEGSTDIVWENNVVYRCKSAGFHQHYGRENLVRNNIFAFSREHQLMRTREEDHLSFIFTNNIVYFDSGTLLGSNWRNDRFSMDGNVYYDTRAPDDPGAMKFAGVSWEEWRRRGHDGDSVVADPLFVAPGEFNFELRAESPALKLGFKPIDLSRVGVRAKSERK